MDPSAPSSNKRKRSNDGSPSDNPRQLSGMEDPDPHAPQFSASAPPNAVWIKAQSPYEPPFGKWVRAPPPYAVLHALWGLPPLPYDRSPPLLMTPPLSMPQHASQMTAPPPNAPLKFPRGRRRDTYDEPIDTIDTRRLQAFLFKKSKLHTCLQNNNSVTKACIRESAIYDLPDKSVGITWVGVHGMDSICVVTRNKDLDHLEHEVLRREKTLDTEEFLRSFWNVLVSEVEVEDFEGRSGESCQMFNDSTMKPFGVVCVVSGNNEVEKSSGHEASSAEFDPDKAIKFLQDEMKSDSAFTFDKTVLTAISAFQHLFLEMFEADEMRVFAWKKDEIIGKELQQERKDTDVEELLASLNWPDRSPIWSSRRNVSRSPVRRAPPKRSPSCSPVRAPSRTTRCSYSRSHRYRSLSRSPFAEGSPKRIRRGRGFSDRFSYPQRFRSPSHDRSPLRSYRYSGRSDRDRYSSFRRSPRRYRSPIRDRTPPRYRSRRSKTAVAV